MRLLTFLGIGFAAMAAAWAAGPPAAPKADTCPDSPVACPERSPATVREDGSPAWRKPKREIRMVQKGFLWIDAEDFSDYGGWTLDTQFVHLMGSAYLIAAGAGTPVDDATVEVDVPERGTYRLWVRAKNWLKAYSPGRFAVRVGDMLSEADFGIADTEDWIWQAGGEFDLPAGPVRIALHDLTGYYGRRDAVILTTVTKKGSGAFIGAMCVR